MTLPPEEQPALPTDNPFPPPPGHAPAHQEQQEGEQQALNSATIGEEEDEDLEQGPEPELHNGQGGSGYFSNVAALLKAGGWLVLRTCNHTSAEINDLLRTSNAPLALVREVTVGGAGVRTLVLQKRLPTVTAPSA
mmetsp:Transcript_40084/g.80803  ORF Transcript_40084/g.80803 Transcript_40084/m.80803 type:complete len:136 (-) Transcript_40084:186-593(-)